MAQVTLQNISKVYNDGNKSSARKKAVDNISFTVHDKEFMVLVGPSGCGKSTLLRMIAGIEDGSEGTLVIDGKEINDLSPRDRDIAMVFQNYALYPHMTVYDNMAFGLKLKNFTKTEIKKRVNETAHLLEIEDELYRKPKTLSGGQRQRVAIGRAIIRRPKVFLFDEPLSNLDAKLRSQMRIELQNYIGGKVQIGIRPEDICLFDEDVNKSKSDCTLTVMAYENMGNEQLIYLSLAQQTLIARRPPLETVDVGKDICIRFSTDKIIYMDEKTGDVISKYE